MKTGSQLFSQQLSFKCCYMQKKVELYLAFWWRKWKLKNSRLKCLNDLWMKLCIYVFCIENYYFCISALRSSFNLLWSLYCFCESYYFCICKYSQGNNISIFSVTKIHNDFCFLELFKWIPIVSLIKISLH